MNKGIIYVMTTAVPGVVKIGRTGTDGFLERMRNLEQNGYYNISGLKRFFAIELEDYEDKEKLLHEIFSKHQLNESELFALDKDLIRQLLLSFRGKVVYPEGVDQEKQFDEVTKERKRGEFFNFYQKGLVDGDEIVFVEDPTIIATICGEREVMYDDQVWKLSPLTRDVYESRGVGRPSGAYRGAEHWLYNGELLYKLPDKN